MNNDLYITLETKILAIIKQIVSIVPKIIEKKEVYEALEIEFCTYYYKLNRDDQMIKRLYPTASCNVNKAAEEYESELNLLDSYLEKYDEDVLNAIIDYLDIDIKSENNDIKKSVLIRDYIIRDFEILKNSQMQLPNSELYRGTITLIEIVLEKKNTCELKIKEYNTYTEKNEKLGLKYDEVVDLIEEKEKKIKKLESMFINKIFKRTELKKLKNNFEELEKIWDDLLLEIYINEEVSEQLSKEKSKFCIKYIVFCNTLDLIIDRLGEKSLKELIQRLNINIVSTNDNYFDEKGEMRKALKKWFELENKKINNEMGILELSCEKKEKSLNKQLKK